MAELRRMKKEGRGRRGLNGKTRPPFARKFKKSYWRAVELRGFRTMDLGRIDGVLLDRGE